MTKAKFVIFLAITLPYFLIYRAFFTGSHLAFGDAPYFYSENLQELFSKPLVWDFRNSNFGTEQFQVLWLYLPTYLMGFLNHVFGLQGDFLVRLVFYFPATIFSLLGAWFFIRQFVKNHAAQILGSLLYGFNTYFLVLIDGGQIGVALAYGLFPLTLLALSNFISTPKVRTPKVRTPKVRNFFLVILILTVLSNVDVRIALLSLLSLILFSLVESFYTRRWSTFLKVFYLLPILAIVALNAFWVLPFVHSIQNESFNNPIPSAQNFLSLANGLFLFNPHFPKNEFGQISLVPFYFSLVPLLIFGGLFFKKDRKMLSLSLVTLMLIFLLKGKSDPSGFLYGWFLDNIPFASAFRDSSKFFVPTMIFSSTLLGLTVEKIIYSIKDHKKWSVIFLVVVYIYIFLLIWPAIFGKMSGILNISTSDKDYRIIYQHLQNDKPFYRTLWFSERPPLAFSVQGKEALSANLLYKDLPFASMIVGDYDFFYFLHNPELNDWFKLLGIKYVFFPENERKKTWTNREKYERGLFLNFVDSLEFEKLNWGTSFPGYKVSDPNPKIFGQDKVILVLGGTNVYDDLRTEVKDFSLSNQGFVFLEDGISNPGGLLNLPKDSVILILKDRDQQDLAMIFLQSKFFGDKNLSHTNFGKYSKDQYLNLKYELLKHGLISSDLQFGKGMYFSDQIGEKLQFKGAVENTDKYRLAFRSISASDSAGLKVSLASQGETLQLLNSTVKNEDHFKWFISEPLNLRKGAQEIGFENLGGFSAINVVSLIPETEFQDALKQADDFLNKFGGNNYIKSLQNLKQVGVTYKEIDPTKYEINLSGKHSKWIIFSDHFDKGWQLNSSNPQPFYSMINGFFIDKNADNKLILVYRPQADVDSGLKISLITLGIFILASLASWHRLR